MAVGSLIVNILAGEDFSEPIALPWDRNLGIAYVATQDDVTSDVELELYVQSKKDANVWLPLYNPTKDSNASIKLIKDKIIPCSPYVDGRGAKAFKFRISTAQDNDVSLEIGLVNF